MPRGGAGLRQRELAGGAEGRPPPGFGGATGAREVQARGDIPFTPLFSAGGVEMDPMPPGFFNPPQVPPQAPQAVRGPAGGLRSRARAEGDDAMRVYDEMVRAQSYYMSYSRRVFTPSEKDEIVEVLWGRHVARMREERGGDAWGPVEVAAVVAALDRYGSGGRPLVGLGGGGGNVRGHRQRVRAPVAGMSGLTSERGTPTTTTVTGRTEEETNTAVVSTPTKTGPITRGPRWGMSRTTLYRRGTWRWRGRGGQLMDTWTIVGDHGDQPWGYVGSTRIDAGARISRIITLS
jgi:hypothetical protein